ncbi:threonine-phosphate decarboxylase CobD [Deltaproteobacteria bacterium TL4]
MTSQTYQHGGEPGADFKRLGIRPRALIDFSVNVNPLGPPEMISAQWQNLKKEIVLYPTPTGEGVSHFFEKRLALPKTSILAGNGSTECLYLVPRALSLKKVAILTPCFHDYEQACVMAKAKVLRVPYSPEEAFAPLKYSILKKILKKSNALFIGNPNNPTGTFYEPELLLKLADKFPEKWILVDEAFIHYLNNFEHQTLAKEKNLRPNLLIFQSLTKFYALPGLRLGCVISHPQTIEKLKPYKEPWTINRVAETIAKYLVEGRAYEDHVRCLNQQENQNMRTALGALEGLKVYEAPANFLLLQWTATKNLDDLQAYLMANGFYVRDCRNFPGLQQNFFRIAIRTTEENQQLLAALKQCLVIIRNISKKSSF